MDPPNPHQPLASDTSSRDLPKVVLEVAGMGYPPQETLEAYLLLVSVFSTDTHSSGAAAMGQSAADAAGQVPITADVLRDFLDSGIVSLNEPTQMAPPSAGFFGSPLTQQYRHVNPSESEPRTDQAVSPAMASSPFPSPVLPAAQHPSFRFPVESSLHPMSATPMSSGARRQRNVAQGKKSETHMDMLTALKSHVLCHQPNRVCVKCGKTEKRVRLISCNHFLSCLECSKRLMFCPVCKRLIKGRSLADKL